MRLKFHHQMTWKWNYVLYLVDIQLRTHKLETVCCVISHEFALFLMRRGFFFAVSGDIILSKSVVTRFPAARLNYKIFRCTEQRVFLYILGSFRMFPESLYF